MKEVFIYGSVRVDTDDEDTAISEALEHINNNPKDFVEVKEVEK